jgi:VWFA-related protein
VSLRSDREPLFAKLNRANVAVYTLDARGTQAARPGTDFLNPSYGDMGTLQEISSRIGGTLFQGNDLDEGMRLALEDMRISYTLGFTLSSSAATGIHELRLRTTRPGVTLRYRESYRLDDKPRNPKPK